MQNDESFLNTAPCFYFCADEDGMLIDVNETLCTKLGFTRHELLGKKTDSVFTIATRIFHQTHLLPLLKMQGFAEEIFASLQTRNKEQIPVLLNAETKMEGAQSITVYIAIKINHRTKFEDELIAAKKAAEKALNENVALIQAKQQLQHHMEQLDEQLNIVNKKNEELRQFNHVVTHDLQEPLRKLFLYADKILTTETRDDHEKAINSFVRVLQQMRSVTAGLQQYVWLIDTNPTIVQVDLNMAFNAAHQQIKKEFPEIVITVEKENLSSLPGDFKQLQMLFYQLLSNAVKFRKPDSDVHVTITQNDVLLNRFHKLADKYNYTKFLKIDIADNGTGFNPAYKEQVFHLFRRLHTGSGSGVGLALCKKIVENHHGSITINSDELTGTTVTFFLPLNTV